MTAAAAVQASLGHVRQIFSSSALMQLVDTVCSPPRLRGWMSGRTSNSLSVDRSSGVRKARIHPNSYDILAVLYAYHTLVLNYGGRVHADDAHSLLNACENEPSIPRDGGWG